MSFWVPISTLIAAVLSAIVALIGVLFSAHSSRAVTERQSRGQAAMKIAEFRQAWIDKLGDSMAELCGIVISPWGSVEAIPERFHALERYHKLRCKIELLVNPKDPAYPRLVELLSKFDISPDYILSGSSDTDASELITTCQCILKREWETLKREVRTPGFKI